MIKLLLPPVLCYKFNNPYRSPLYICFISSRSQSCILLFSYVVNMHVEIYAVKLDIIIMGSTFPPISELFKLTILTALVLQLNIVSSSSDHNNIYDWLSTNIPKYQYKHTHRCIHVRSKYSNGVTRQMDGNNLCHPPPYNYHQYYNNKMYRTELSQHISSLSQNI